MPDIKSVRKKDGFNGQRAIVLPKGIIHNCENNILTAPLHLTDIGYYPKAKFHYRNRAKSIAQHILIYCVDGRGWASIADRKINIEKGEILLLPAGTVHCYGADEDNPWSIYWLHFKGDAAASFAGMLTSGATLFNAPASYSDKRMGLFQDMYNTLQKGYSTIHLNYACMLLWSYIGTFCYPELFNQEVKTNEPVDAAIEHMVANINKSLTLDEIAAVVHLSGSHFCSLFKKKTGYAPLEYYSHLKVQKACQYLEFTNMHVKELCYELGFNDPFYFSRFFNRHMGESPVEYRKRKRFK